MNQIPETRKEPGLRCRFLAYKFQVGCHCDVAREMPSFRVWSRILFQGTGLEQAGDRILDFCRSSLVNSPKGGVPRRA